MNREERDRLAAMDWKERLAYGRTILEQHNDPIVKAQRDKRKWRMKEAMIQRKRKQEAKERAEKAMKEKKEKGHEL